MDGLAVIVCQSNLMNGRFRLGLLMKYTITIFFEDSYLSFAGFWLAFLLSL